MPNTYKEIDFKVLDALLQFKASKRYCAKYLDVSEDTVERRIKEKTGQTFSGYADEQLDGTRLKLQQKAIQLALKGDRTMLIFCLKNLCNWSDKVETSLGDNAAPLVLNYSLEGKKAG
jgi:hypothetical protein